MAWTDYPIHQPDDHSVKRVRFISFDGNKYCKIAFKGIVYEMKLGYLFKDKKLRRRFSLKRPPKNRRKYGSINAQAI